MNWLAKWRAKRGRCPLCGRKPLINNNYSSCYFFCLYHCYSEECKGVNSAYKSWLKTIREMANSL